MNDSPILAVVVERRILAAVVVQRGRPVFAEVRQLRPTIADATRSIEANIERLITTFIVQSAFVLVPPDKAKWRRSVLADTAARVLRAAGVVVTDGTKEFIFDHFGTPPLRSRVELRSVIRPFWTAHSVDEPVAYVLDAFAAGLLAYYEQLLRVVEEGT